MLTLSNRIFITTKKEVLIMSTYFKHLKFNFIFYTNIICNLNLCIMPYKVNYCDTWMCIKYFFNTQALVIMQLFCALTFNNCIEYRGILTHKYIHSYYFIKYRTFILFLLSEDKLISVNLYNSIYGNLATISCCYP